MKQVNLIFEISEDKKRETQHTKLFLHDLGYALSPISCPNCFIRMSDRVVVKIISDNRTITHLHIID